ncbi:DNA-directed primase/polymerase protein-like [Saccostrea echinata]|uniref:DNA-directed primase/polymerase protein-like n=1 Tax=Saccostrea echinata TaxID=191078 RepID=UPI002A815D65|nr:DNA-directed primase/polymerase protein-like [Saccostrea echinata]
MSTISRGVFYGLSNKNALRKRKLIENTLNEKVKNFKENSIPKNYNQRITGPVFDWKLFYRQQSAFNYARDQSEELHVFAFESSSLGLGDGKRMYLVSSYEVFWHYYSQLSSEKKLHYEIIPEGSVCKLYFDLEYSIPDNLDQIGIKMVDTFIQYVCLWLDLEFSLKCTRKNVLDLDASTDKKFSRHLVFLLPDVAFQDNITVGNFVQHIITALSQHCECKTVKGEQSLHDSNEACTSQRKEDDATRAKQQGKSSEKFEGQTERTGTPQDWKKFTDEVLIGENDQMPEEGGKKEKLSDSVFEHFTEEQLSSLFVKTKKGEKTAFCDLGVYTKNRNFRLYLSSKFGKNNPLVVAPENEFLPSTATKCYEEGIFMQSLISNVKFSPRMRILKFGGMQRDSRRFVKNSSTCVASLEGYRTSPYPEIDAFLGKLVQEVDTRGGIRHWTYFSQGELIVYEMANYRFCHNINRSHRSNNVMFIVDLKKRIYYQKCHDPVCRSQNFKSSDFPLPDSVFPVYLWEDDPMFDGEDVDLCSAVDEAERTMPV